MALKPPAPGVVEQDQSELKTALAGSTVPGVNVEAAKQLASKRSFEWPPESGKWYDVPRVPYEDGLAMNDLFLRIKEQEKYPPGVGANSIYKAMLNSILRIAWDKLIVPRSWWMRLRKCLGLVSNPLYQMSEGEIGDLLAFFLVRRMVSTVQFHSPATPHLRNQNQPT